VGLLVRDREGRDIHRGDRKAMSELSLSWVADSAPEALSGVPGRGPLAGWPGREAMATANRTANRAKRAIHRAEGYFSAVVDDRRRGASRELH
jgi:hypothetical protein